MDLIGLDEKLKRARELKEEKERLEKECIDLLKDEFSKSEINDFDKSIECMGVYSAVYHFIDNGGDDLRESIIRKVDEILKDEM